MSSEQKIVTWDVRGSYFENCNCNVMCPCYITGMRGADEERCIGAWVAHIEEGTIQGIDVSHLNVIVLWDALSGASREPTDRTWRTGLIIDEAATDEQADILAAFFSGTGGGRWAWLAEHTDQMLGIERAPMQYVDDGLVHRVIAGDLVHIEIEEYAARDGGPRKLAGMPHPYNSELAVAQATRAEFNVFGETWDSGGKSGYAAPFSWKS